MGGACSTYGRREMHTKFWTENMKGGDHMEDPGIDEKILEWILGKQGKCVLDSSGSGYGMMVGSCEHGNEPIGSIKSREFCDY
jgi:hypothetical protein